MTDTNSVNSATSAADSESLKLHFSRSVMSYITLSLVSIIAVALLSIFISFWVTELADKDAQAINLSGSMRMRTYQIGMEISKGEITLAKKHVQELDKIWLHPLFAGQRLNTKDSVLNRYFETAFNHWNWVLKPTLESSLSASQSSKWFPFELFNTQVELTDQVVQQFQKDAENKIRRLRSFQLFALFLTIVVGSLIFHLLKTRIEKPLNALTNTAYKLGQGDYRQRVDIEGEDELGLLGAVFNQMGTSIENAYNQLEQRVKDRTEELYRKNVTLQFLFNTARKIIESQENGLDHQQVVDDLSSVIGAGHIELCLFTRQGELPYLHLAPQSEPINDCSNRSCDDCRFRPTNCAETEAQDVRRFPINLETNQYGLLSINVTSGTGLQDWQEQLLRSVADQLAIALSLGDQKDNQRRLAMLNERTVIARELHDSLAQALSYLQIQVTRLQKSRDQDKYHLQQPIIDELREGLSSAYRQLRELLTTFRLKIGVRGLQGALENTVKQLQERTDMKIALNYQLSNLPLSPMEEIHVLQIAREASQNAVHHSRGKQVNISLQQKDHKTISLQIADDGIGMKESPEKLNHYGLAIMKERSHHLGGRIDIQPNKNSGTKVEFSFVPQFLKSV
ncbi:MAG: histidine kinase [Exilibacterium sp.]